MIFRKIVAIGLLDRVVRRATAIECRKQGIRYNDSKTSKVPYWDVSTSSIVFIHPSSSTAKTHPPPDFCVYSTLQRVKREGQRGNDDEPKGPKLDAHGKPILEGPSVFMRGVTIVSRTWLDEIGFDEEQLEQDLRDV